MEAVLEATARETIGKNEARRTRRSGQVPAVLYGSAGGDGNKDPRPISVDPAAQNRRADRSLMQAMTRNGMPFAHS